MDRTVLTFLIDAYERERSVDPNGKETERTVLRFHPQIAPVQVAVFSLARNKPELVERARAIEAALRPTFRTQYDEGNIGQLYRRQDEIGTPFCVTVDYETLGDGSVTVRARDSMRQERVRGDALDAYLEGEVGTMSVQVGTKYVYFFDEGETLRRPRIRVHAEHARRKGRRPRRDDARPACRCRRASRSRPRRVCVSTKPAARSPTACRNRSTRRCASSRSAPESASAIVENPLLVSVRSGARVSMPGMMDTILNLGLNDETVAGLARLTENERFAWDAYRRFIMMFSNVVLGIGKEHFEELIDGDEEVARRGERRRDRRRVVASAGRAIQGDRAREHGRRVSAGRARAAATARSRRSSTRGTPSAPSIIAASTRSPTTGAPPST